MDQIKDQNKLNCKEHINKELEFFKVNETINLQDDQKLFYCTSCINDDPFFKQANYQLISQIIEQGSTNIMKKWPPINDNTIILKLADLLNKNQNTDFISDQIISYFSDLKHEILTKIDICQKKMIHQVHQQFQNNSQILKKYQDFSKIIELKSLLSNDQRYSIERLEEECKKLIQTVESDKGRNSELLQNLLEQVEKQQNLLNLIYPQIIKENILFSIDQINFFNESDNNQINNNFQENNNKIDLIMKLISNKSNYCSDEFLESLRQQLNKVFPIFQQSTIENIFVQDKQQINFQELSNQQLDLISTYVEHSIKLKNNQDYQTKIQNSIEIKQISELISNKVNFTDNTFQGQFEKYLIETYPYLKQINFTNIITERNKFECFKSLSEDIVNDVFTLIKKRLEFDEHNQFANNQTNNILQQQMQLLRQYFKEDEINSLFKKYPILDLIQKQRIEIENQMIIIANLKQDILPNIQLQKSGFQLENNTMVINKNENNNQEIQSNQNNIWQFCVSNIHLDQDTKYIFRIKIQNFNNEDKKQFEIGLHYKNQTSGLVSHLYYQGKQIQQEQNSQICKQIKGNGFNISADSLIEMRVHLKQQILEILDFPNYTLKFTVDDSKKDFMKKFNDFQLGLDIYNENIKLILVNAFCVQQFVD